MAFNIRNRVPGPEFDANNWDWSPNVADRNSRPDTFPNMTHSIWLPGFLVLPEDWLDPLKALMPTMAFSVPHDPAGNLLPRPGNYAHVLKFPELPRDLSQDEIEKRKISMLIELRVVTYWRGWDGIKIDD